MATAYDIIIRPIITERAMSGAANKKYVFEVAKDAGKIEIKKAVEEIFGVKVASVNTLTVPGKEKRMGAGRPGMTKTWKRPMSSWRRIPRPSSSSKVWSDKRKECNATCLSKLLSRRLPPDGR